MLVANLVAHLGARLQVAVLHQMLGAAAVAQGEWILVEEGDFGLFELCGAPESARVSDVLHEIFAR